MTTPLARRLNRHRNVDAPVAVSSSGYVKPPSLCLEDKRQVTSIMSAQPTHEPNHKVYNMLNFNRLKH